MIYLSVPINTNPYFIKSKIIFLDT